MNKLLALILALTFITPLCKAQTDSIGNKYIESELVPLAGKKGINLTTQAGDFSFKPYVLVQTRAIGNYYDNEGLNLAEQDNVFNSGFGVPFALVGFAGKAFNKVTFNLALNAAASGGAMLNQAWFDINAKESLRFRIGKFKTPFNQAYLVRLGQTLFPTLPSSLVTRVNLPMDINSVNPVLSTGFDVGAQVHGVINNKWAYQVGVFNGTGISVNHPTNGTSDDFGIPSLLYAARGAYMPFGEMPLHQGDPEQLNFKKMLFAVSTSYNVEANWESSNDLRIGFEFAMLLNKLYLGAEAYALNMDFTERQQTSPNYMFSGGYIQSGYFLNNKVQPMVRADFMDRNSTDNEGILFMPALGCNYYIIGHNLKLQAYYQYLGKSGHASLFEENDDDNGMAEHQVCFQLQFAF